MAREIIQNADDCGAKVLKFDIQNDALEIWNDAEFSNCSSIENVCPWLSQGNPISGTKRACDFHAISNVGSSNKYREEGLIGRFGIGFVSVYQITDAPQISSGGTKIELDPITEEVQETLAHTSGGSKFELPFAFDAHSPVREALEASPLIKPQIDTLENDICLVAETCLLFLRNLEEIQVRRLGKLKSKVTKSQRDDSTLQITFPLKNIEEHWYVMHFDASEKANKLKQKYPAIERLDRQTNGQIAFKLGQFENRIGSLFAYLPTEQDSPIPCHINADFFPEQTRKKLVLSGEQHERYWNEMLLEVCAKQVAKELSELKKILGFQRFWQMIGEAFEHKEIPHFRVFWDEITISAASEDLAWSSVGEWAHIETCYFAQDLLSKEQEFALNHIGLRLIHKSLQSHKDLILALGAPKLTANTIIHALEIWDQNKLDKDIENSELVFGKLLPPIWGMINDSLPKNKITLGNGETISVIEDDQIKNLKIFNNLKKIRFIPDHASSLKRIDDLYRVPSTLKNEEILKHFAGLPIVNESFKDFQELHKLLDILNFDSFLVELAAEIESEETALEFFGDDKSRIQDFYKFLASYPRSKDTDTSNIVENTPFLIGHKGFLTPNNAVWPGGFTDPVGRFNTLNLNYFSEKDQKFLTDVLGVKILTLESYIEQYLPEILDDGLTDDQYSSLIDIISSKKKLLQDMNIKNMLINLPLVKTEDDQLSPASQCYFKSNELIEILGDDRTLWVKESIFKETEMELYKGFFRSLGMRTQPTLEHTVNRIEKITENSPSNETRNFISAIFKFLVKIFLDDKLEENEEIYENEIRRLRYLSWLPAIKDEEKYTEFWFAPNMIFQPFRVDGFSTQVKTLDTAELGRLFTDHRNFLKFLKMPKEPQTSVIVQHLNTCMQREMNPGNCYQILSERYGENNGVCFIEELKGKNFIYSSNKKKFFGADCFFWNEAFLGKYCFTTPKWMNDIKEIFVFLGVLEEPSAETYVSVLIQIAEEFGRERSKLPGDIKIVHGTCTRKLGEKNKEDPAATASHLERLRNYPFLLTQADTLAFTNEVAVQDSDWLNKHFGDILDPQLVQSSMETEEVISWFKLRPLSTVLRLEPYDLGELVNDSDATILMRDRQDLLEQLVSEFNFDIRSMFTAVLQKTELVRTDKLIVRSVFQLDDVPVKSAPRESDVLFYLEKEVLYASLDLEGSYWGPAFYAIFSTLLSGERISDIRNLALCADSVLSEPSRNVAENKLLQLGYIKRDLQEEQQKEIQGDVIGELEIDPEIEMEIEDQIISSVFDQANANSASDKHVASEENDSWGAMDPFDDGDKHIEENNDSEEAGVGVTAGVRQFGEMAPDLVDNKIKNSKDFSKRSATNNASDQHIAADKSENWDRMGRLDNGATHIEKSNELEEEGLGAITGLRRPNETPPDRLKKAEENRNRSARTEWMRSYVIPERSEPNNTDQPSDAQVKRNASIDEAAMNAVIEYEFSRNFEPERQGHYNPGYDIVSRSKRSDEKRLIEVKGLENEWTNRGVKLSKTQVLFAQDNPDEIWLYVVECALDKKHRKINAIKNPFSRANEFWFDREWRELADEKSVGYKEQLLPECRIQVTDYGEGTIHKVKKAGELIYLTIIFDSWGEKVMTYNASRMELLEE
jgi:hypothetical protein